MVELIGKMKIRWCQLSRALAARGRVIPVIPWKSVARVAGLFALLLTLTLPLPGDGIAPSILPNGAKTWSNIHYYIR